MRARLGLAEFRLGNGERGRRLLQHVADSIRSVMEDTEDSPYALFLLTDIQAALGQPDRALEYLERRWHTGSDLPVRGLLSPFLDDFRSEPRFQAILKEFQSQQRKARQRVLELNLDLYPPGAEPDSREETTMAPR